MMKMLFLALLYPVFGLGQMSLGGDLYVENQITSALQWVADDSGFEIKIHAIGLGDIKQIRGWELGIVISDSAGVVYLENFTYEDIKFESSEALRSKTAMTVKVRFDQMISVQEGTKLEVMAQILPPSIKKGRRLLSKGNLWILDYEKPTVVVDIDRTISEAKGKSVWAWRLGMEKRILGAQSYFTELARSGIQIIYLTNRTGELPVMGNAKDQREWTERWLKHNQFPEGPVIIRNGQNLIGASEFKRDAVLKVKDLVRNVIAGFGDRPGDIRGYTDAEIESVRVGTRMKSSKFNPSPTLQIRNFEPSQNESALAALICRGLFN